MSAKTFKVKWREDGSATVLGRLTARNGSGAATGVAGEGNWIQQADVSSIAYSAFDVSDPDTAVATGTATVSSAVLDTPVTTNTLWTVDTTGYNFIHDLPPATFPAGGDVNRVEYKVTLTGGAVLWGVFEGTAEKVLTS